ncbi:flavin reductase family protein [Pseudomonas rhizophila]
MKKLSFDYPERLDVEFWLDDEKGIPTSTAFEKYVDSDSEAEYFICGPAPFMEGVGRFLMDSKVPLDLITKESFAGGVSDDNIEKNESKEKDVTVSVVLNGVRTDVMCSEGSYILKEIISAGVNVPNSCGAGNCGSCMCSLLSGDVVLEKNTVLDPSMKKMAGSWRVDLNQNRNI